MFDIGSFLSDVSNLYLIFIFIVSLVFLSKSADYMVEHAIKISLKWGLPPVVIGATIISLGTTLPEVVVSVMASLRGKPGIALGNSVGSIICDTGLILGLAILIGKIPLERETVKRQSWLQLLSVALLIGFSLLHANWPQPFLHGGYLPQYVGMMFTLLLVIYLILQVKWGKNSGEELTPSHEEVNPLKSILIMICSFVVLAASSEILIETATEAARRLSVPENIIAVTLVAFGTSLPELITSFSAVRKGFGGIALGNVIGADILNVLLVAGLSAAVTPAGLTIAPNFYYRTFPMLVIIILTCRAGLSLSNEYIEKKYGVMLLGLYLIITLMNLIN